MQEEELWDMSDEDLEASFKEARASEYSPETDIGNETNQPEPLEEEPELDDVVDEDLPLYEENKGSEQPEDNLEDSDHDTSYDTETDEVVEEGDEAAKEDPEADAKAEDDTSSEDAEEDDEEERPAQLHKFRANGREYAFSGDEIVDQFPRIFGQAMDYTKKMQAIKPWRKTIDALESAKLNHDDVNMMIDVLKGDKDAIAAVFRRTGVDTLELDTDEYSNYVAKDYGRNDSDLAIKDIVDDISRDAEYATTQHILSKEWDDKSWAAMADNPEMIRLLHTDVKTGMFDTVQPIAEKLKVYDGGRRSDLDYYKEAAKQHFSRVTQQNTYEERQRIREEKQAAAYRDKSRLAEVKAQSDQRIATQKASVKRKAAAPSVPAAGRDVVDYLEDSDEAFDDWYKNLQNDN